MTDGIVNGVLVVKKGEPIWVYSELSVLTYGLIEGTMSVGEIDDDAVATTIAEEWLSVRATPLESAVYKAIDVTDAVGGVDFVEGDTLADPALRVTEIAFEVRPDGRLASTPVLASKFEESFSRNQAKIDRLIAEAGGTSPVSSRPSETGSEIEAGKLQPRQVTSWTWTDSEMLDPLFNDFLDEDEKAWQRFTIDEPIRLTELLLECDYQDEDEFQVADGPTRFRLLINDVAPVSIPALGSIPIDVEVGQFETTASVPIFGGTILQKGYTVAVTPVSNGGHINGACSLFGSEVV